MRRSKRFRSAGLAWLTLSCCTCLLRPVAALDADPDEHDRAVLVQSVSGETEWRARGRIRFQRAAVGTRIGEGDAMRTWRASRARLRTSAGDLVLLGSQSRVERVEVESVPDLAGAIEKARDGGDGGLVSEAWPHAYALSLIEGRLEARLEGTLAVSVEAAGLTVLATAASFRVTAEPGEAARVEVLSGTVSLVLGDDRSSLGALEGALVRNSAHRPRLHEVRLPSPPARLLPVTLARGAEGVTARLRWDPVEGGQAYRVQMAATAGFEEVLYERRTGAERSLSIPLAALPSGAAYWRVTSMHDGGFESAPSRSSPTSLDRRR